MDRQGYRQAFEKASTAARYDDVVYASGSYSDILWQVERLILRSFASYALGNKPATRYLDFACGTGRIVAELEGLAANATGIDISPAMLELAGKRCRSARLIAADITRGEGIQGSYDLITAFRFVTNAEPALRLAALKALRGHLRDDGVLLINIHGNPWSYRLMTLPYHWIRDRLSGRPLYGYLSVRQLIRLLHQADFQIEAVIGMGFVPEKMLPIVTRRLVYGVESTLAALPGVQRFGLNQLFVCRTSTDGGRTPAPAADRARTWRLLARQAVSAVRSSLHESR